jgi:NADH:ubiquinone oxidoreductase subunit 2 (subunit N)
MRLSLLGHVVRHYSGADYIRYIQYYSIMVALASIVHNRYILDYISNCATGCELSALWAMIIYGILLSGLVISDRYDRQRPREYYIFYPVYIIVYTTRLNLVWSNTWVSITICI